MLKCLIVDPDSNCCLGLNYKLRLVIVVAFGRSFIASFLYMNFHLQNGSANG